MPLLFCGFFFIAAVYTFIFNLLVIAEYSFVLPIISFFWGYKLLPPFEVFSSLHSSSFFSLTYKNLQIGLLITKLCFSSNMSYSNYPTGSGARSGRRTFEFGRTHVVRPKGRHLATIVWLHGLGDNGASACQLVENLPLPNVKFICPTAPTRSVALLGGFSCTAWFDVAEISEDSQDDLEGLDASAAHIANLLSTEPADVKLGIGGFSMGAALALYSASCFAVGNYANGNFYPINLRAIVGLSGWLPGARSLRNKIGGSHDASRRAGSLPIFICHGRTDEVVAYRFGEKSAQVMSSAGFRNLTFKAYDNLGHYTIPAEMNEVCNFLVPRLGLEQFR